MGLVYTQTDSGLVLAEHGQDEAAVAAALHDHDRNLRLTRQIDPHYQCWVWIVRYQASPERSEVLLSWRDPDGTPRPLSSALVDRVKELDKNSSYREPDPDQMNQKLRARRRKEWDDEAGEIVREFGPRLEGKKSSPLPRGVNLRMARDRVRARTRARELEP